MNVRNNKPLFEMLDPPPGGLTRLQARIRGERRRKIRNWTLATAAAGIAAIGLAVLLLLPNGGELPLLPGFESDLLAIQLGLIEAPEESVSIRPDLRNEYAVLEIPTGDDRVVFYMVGSR